MKKILLVFIIALLTLFAFHNEQESETYLDFDDYDPIEIVRI